MLRSAPLRVLADRDVDDVLRLLATDPVANVFVTSRIEACGLDPWRLGAEVWGHFRGSELDAICFVGANLVPVTFDDAACAAFAERARRAGRRSSSMVGTSACVDPLWNALRPTWGPPRDVRHQPLMATTTPSPVPGDPEVRQLQPRDLETVLPACIAMYTEEVGVSPVASDGGALYRARVAELITQGRCYARIEDGRVLFKADVGAASRWACQIQGVWVDPELRGQGLGTAGMAAVVDAALSSHAPVVSLYVNDYNVAARRAYAAVGFTDVGQFTSVLF